MKNIVICCDGTGNQYGATNTNVVKLFQALDLGNDATPRQVAFYDPGVGTGNPRGAITRTRVFISRVLGLAFGTGIYRNMSDAYGYLMEQYQPDDRVYIFGFSRGAYTARALTGMLHMLGLLQPGSSNLIPYALELYRKRMPKDDVRRSEYFKVARGFKKTYSRVCKPHFIGVWDTVKTVGHVAFGRHAISIDEKRSRFRPNMWGYRDDNNLQQVWFAGVHSDVGGGYKEFGLSDIALQWMLKGAEHEGLVLRKDAYEDINPKPEQDMHNSLKWYWMPAGWKRRTVRGPGTWNEKTRSWDAHPPAVHESVLARKEKMDYEPSLPAGSRFVDDSWGAYSERPD